MFYLMAHSTHFIYGYMASDIGFPQYILKFLFLKLRIKVLLFYRICVVD